MYLYNEKLYISNTDTNVVYFSSQFNVIRSKVLIYLNQYNIFNYLVSFKFLRYLNSCIKNKSLHKKINN